MSGHHPISKLFEKLTQEDRRIIEEVKSELLADIERREAQVNGYAEQEDIPEPSEETASPNNPLNSSRLYLGGSDSPSMNSRFPSFSSSAGAIFSLNERLPPPSIT